MKTPPDHFRNCPACGAAIDPIQGKRLACPACGFSLYFNPAIGVAGFIRNPHGQVLLIRRGKDPAKGRLAPPGGFADFWETAEAALSREVREETGLEVTRWQYLSNAVNTYTYAGVTYPVLDLFFHGRTIDGGSLELCDEETSGAAWHDPASIDPDALAFPSMQAAFRAYRKEVPGS